MGGGGISYEKNIETNVGVVASVFFIQCWGLKPSTVHKAYLLDKEVTAECTPIVNASGGVAGSTLTTDTAGYLQFNFYFKPQTSPFQTRFLTDHNTTIALVPVGMQKFRVSNSDGSSFAQGFIEQKPAT